MSSLPIWTIPPDCSFVEVLAAQLLAEQDAGELTLSETTVLLPTRRALRSLQEAFLRQTEAKALLLPRMITVGDTDPDELDALALQDLPEDLGAQLELPPAIGSTERRLFLTQLILAAQGLFSASAEQALVMADELARLLDQCQTEAIDLARLDALAEEGELAEHWSKTLDFLKLIREVWPAILKERGQIDPAQHRYLAMMVRAEAWAEITPPQPFILAGSTGSILATRRLMATVLRLPKGRLILPGLDTALSQSAWTHVSAQPSHPQHGFALLRDHLADHHDLRFDFDQVPELPVAAKMKLVDPSRARLVQIALLPAKSIADPSEGWRSAAHGLGAAAQDLSYLSCSDSSEEAAVIALKMRQVLEVPEKTAALVTPDRNLARRVQAELLKMDLVVEETAGTPLKNTSAGAFVRLVAKLLAEDFAPVALLSVLKHPLCAIGLEPSRLRQATRSLEQAVLRGPRPQRSGLSGLMAALDAVQLEPNKRKQALLGEAQSLITALQGLEPLVATWGAKEQPLSARLHLHLGLCEAFSLGPNSDHPNPLWQGEAGQALTDLFDQLLQASESLLGFSVKASAYPDLFDTLMGEAAVRLSYGMHPRLAIWGTMEARLQKADVMILGGLNEGTWPVPTDTGPWMSRPMRTAIGLPSPERKIGLSAHDFAQGICSKEVLITRAEKEGGAPTVPSRWLLRLGSVLPKAQKLEDLKPAEPLKQWVTQLRMPASFDPRPRPAPCPPLEARPRSLSVTRIGMWMRDPYALYANKILKLSALDPIDADPTVADKGNVLHDCLHRFVQLHGLDLPPDAEAVLLKMAQEEAANQLQSPLVLQFWQRRQARIVPWFLNEQRKRVQTLKTIVTEKSAAWHLEAPGGAFEITAKADRVDQNHDQSLMLIDYKTGSVPSASDARRGLQPQLPLEALIAMNTGWGDLPAAPVAGLEHWRLTGGSPPGEAKPLLGSKAGEEELIELLERTEAGLRALIDRFDDPQQPYLAQPDPSAVGLYNDYEHLERLAEWSMR